MGRLEERNGWCIWGEGGLRVKVLHPCFRAQSVIKILVIGLASALRLKGLRSSCRCYNSPQNDCFWNRLLDV